MLQLGVSVGYEGGEKGRTRVVFTGLQQDIEEDLDRYVVLIDHVDVDRELLVEVRRSFVHDRNIDRRNPLLRVRYRVALLLHHQLHSSLKKLNAPLHHSPPAPRPPRP